MKFEIYFSKKYFLEWNTTGDWWFGPRKIPFQDSKSNERLVGHVWHLWLSSSRSKWILWRKNRHLVAQIYLNYFFLSKRVLKSFTRSFGCVFHELITTEKLFKDNNNIQIDIKTFEVNLYVDTLRQATQPIFLNILQK